MGKKTKLIEKFFIGIIFLQMVLLFYANFIKMPHLIGFDSSCFLSQAIEMWKQKTLIPSNWAFQTSLYTDSPVILAALLYGLIHNIYIAYGISNIIFILFLLYVIICIYNSLGIPTIGKLVGIALVLTPFSFNGDLGYYSLLFEGSAAYIGKVIFMLLVLKVALNSMAGIKLLFQKKWIAMAMVFAFLTGFSSGYQMLICAVCPIILLYFIQVFINNDIKSFFSQNNIILIGILIIGFLGNFIAASINNVNFGATMRLTGIDEFGSNLYGVIMGFFELFGGIPETTSINLLSVTGITYLIKFIFTFLLIISPLVILPIITYRKVNKRLIVNRFHMIVMSVFFVNCIVVTLVYTKYGATYFEYRYHIFTTFFVLMDLGILVSELKVIKRDLIYKATLLFVVGLIFSSGATAIRTLYHTDNNYKEMNQIISDVDKNESPLVYSFGDDAIKIARVLRVMDTTKTYQFVGNNLQPYNWGNTKKYQDNGEYVGSTTVIVSKGEDNSIPEYIKSNLKLLKSTLNYNIYNSEQNEFDLSNELPDVGQSIDLPYTMGYETTGQFTNFGLDVQGAGNYVMWGPKTQAKTGKYNITLYYDIKKYQGDKCIAFDICTDDGKDIKQVQYIKNDTSSITLKNVSIASDEKNVEYRVWMDSNTQMLIHKINIEKIE